MKQLTHYLLLLVSISLFFSCTPEEAPEPELTDYFVRGEIDGQAFDYRVDNENWHAGGGVTATSATNSGGPWHDCFASFSARIGDGTGLGTGFHIDFINLAYEPDCDSSLTIEDIFPVRKYSLVETGFNSSTYRDSTNTIDLPGTVVYYYKDENQHYYSGNSLSLGHAELEITAVNTLADDSATLDGKFEGTLYNEDLSDSVKITNCTFKFPMSRD